MTWRIGSLFSGIGGLDVGIELALGGETIWQVEQNEYCRQVLAKHWPDVRRYEDVKEVGAHNLEPIDCLIGGFPCQGASSAGKRKGLKDERSGLWFEYARIIRELEPRWVVIENVTGLTHRGLDQVLGSLASLGYSAAWDCLTATDSLSSHGKRWPTPISRDWKSGLVSDETFNKNSRPLCEHVMRWPTPNAMDGKKAPKWYSRGNPSLPCKVEMSTGSRTSDGTKIKGSGSLSPTWVAWLMGFSIGWLC